MSCSSAFRGRDCGFCYGAAHLPAAHASSPVLQEGTCIWCNVERLGSQCGVFLIGIRQRERRRVRACCGDGTVPL